MPGAFHIRTEESKDIFFKEWIGLVILRDLAMIPKVKIDTDLAQSILEQIAVIKEPDSTGYKRPGGISKKA